MREVKEAKLKTNKKENERRKQKEIDRRI